MNTLLRQDLHTIAQSHNPIRIALELSEELLKCDLFKSKIISSIIQNDAYFNNNNSYHNQYHFAEVIYGCTYLLKHEKELTKDEMFFHAEILLTSAAFHDIGHLGRHNMFPYELEKLAIDNMKSFFNQFYKEGLAFKNFYMLEELILGTEFKTGTQQVKKDYQDKKDVVIDGIYLNRLKMLLVESDILLSSLYDFGLNKTGLVLLEENKSVAIEEKVRLWKNFVNGFSIYQYISDASKNIHMREELEYTKNYTYNHINKLSNIR